MKQIIKNQKIRIFSLSIALMSAVSVVFFIQSCSSDYEYNNSNLSNEYEMNNKAANYLVFDNNLFFLNLSKKEALKLGITESYYNKMLSDIENTNAFIHENSMEKSVANSYNEWQINASNSFPRLKSGSENNEGTFWSFPNSSTGTTQSFSYSGGSISFYGNSPCVVTAISIRIVCSGTTINTSMTLYPYNNNSITVRLPYSSGTCSVTANTSCSGGSSLVVR